MGGIVDKLTPRQREVMTLKARGLTEKQIALRLGIAYCTVKTYSRRARERTQRTSAEIMTAVANA
jgi:DNA-binding NarL/FixJ family response regulator